MFSLLQALWLYNFRSFFLQRPFQVIEFQPTRNTVLFEAVDLPKGSLGANTMVYQYWHIYKA